MNGWLYLLYSVLQRYNFESNLQRCLRYNPRPAHCIQYYKDTILKAIYNTKTNIETVVVTVFSITKIQF